MKTIILSHLTSCSKIITSFEECGIEFEIINAEVSKNYTFVPDNENKIKVFGNIYSPEKGRFLRIARFLFGIPILAKILSPFWTNIKKIKSSKKVDFIFANWGAGIIPEINIIQESKAFPRTKTILNLESFPTSWNSKFREVFEIFILKCSLKNIDAFIIPTQTMFDTLKEKVPAIANKSILLSPYFFPATFFLKHVEVPNPEKDLLFLGQLNTKNEINNITHQILELADNDISISCVDRNNLKHKNLSYFSSFASEFLKSGGLYELAQNHKAALATYYLPSAGKIALRYSTSLPHRFLMPLALGLPIVLPKNYFNAMELFIEEHNIGLAYSSTKDYMISYTEMDGKLLKKMLNRISINFFLILKNLVNFLKQSSFSLQLTPIFRFNKWIIEYYLKTPQKSSIIFPSGFSEL